MYISATYDSSVTPGAFIGGQAEETAFKNAIDYVDNLYDSLFTNNVTINIVVGWGEDKGTSIGTGYAAANQANEIAYTYAQVSQALIAKAQSNAQTAADSTLPAVASSPFANMVLTTANANAL